MSQPGDSFAPNRALDGGLRWDPGMSAADFMKANGINYFRIVVPQPEGREPIELGCGLGSAIPGWQSPWEKP